VVKIAPKRRHDFHGCAIHRLIQRLDREAVSIAVDDQRRQKIRFGVHQAVRIGIRNHLFAEPLRRGDSGRDIHRFGRAPQHAQCDLRRRAVMGLPEELAARIEHVDRVARLGQRRIRDIRPEDPGMPGAEAAHTFIGNADTGRQRLFQMNMVADARRLGVVL